jgi:hypothetical protein
VWRVPILPLSPVFKLLSGIVHIPELVCIEGLVLQPSIEALLLSLLHSFARLYVEQLDLFLPAPGKEVS